MAVPCPPPQCACRTHQQVSPWLLSICACRSREGVILTCMPRLTRCGVVETLSRFSTKCSCSRCVAMVICQLSLTPTHAHARAIASRWRLNAEKDNLNAEVDNKKSKDDNKQSLMTCPPLGLGAERARWGAAEQAARVSTQVCRVGVPYCNKGVWCGVWYGVPTKVCRVASRSPPGSWCILAERTFRVELKRMPPTRTHPTASDGGAVKSWNLCSLLRSARWKRGLRADRHMRQGRAARHFSDASIQHGKV